MTGSSLQYTPLWPETQVSSQQSQALPLHPIASGQLPPLAWPSPPPGAWTLGLKKLLFAYCFPSGCLYSSLDPPVKPFTRNPRTETSIHTTQTLPPMVTGSPVFLTFQSFGLRQDNGSIWVYKRFCKD